MDTFIEKRIPPTS